MSIFNAGTQMYYVRKSDGLAYCFSPVPLIAESHENTTLRIDGVSQRVGTTNRITFNGTLLPSLPALSGVAADASCFELLDRKSDQLRSALDEDYGNLLIVDATGYPMLSVNPRITSIEFPESQVVNKRDYSLVFEYESDFSESTKISTFDETWDFSQNDDDTVSVTHNVSAVGIDDLPAGTGALQRARTFVLARANSLDKSQAAFVTTPFVQSIVDVDNLTEYNHVLSESTNEGEGSYSISETWTMASGAFKDDRTVDTTSELDEFGSLIDTLTINGTVVGYGDTTFDRFDNAVTGFTTFVDPQIGFTSANGVQSKSRSDNRFAGSVSYSMAFEPSTTSDLLDRTVNRQFQRNDDGTVTQTVTTSARVPLSSSSGIGIAITFCQDNNFPIDNAVEPFFTASLSGNIESISSTHDDLTKAYSLTKVYRDQATSLYREEYQVSRDQSVDNAITTVTVNGTIAGMAAETSTNSIERWLAASGAYFGTIESLIRTRGLDIITDGSCLGSSPIRQTLGFNKLNGLITYSQTFDNRFATSNSNIDIEEVETNYTLQSDVVAEIPIPAKADGPILQDQETLTGLEKSLRIRYKMTPSGLNCGEINLTNQGVLEQEALTESNILVNNTLSENPRGEKPVATRVFKTADNYSWNRNTLDFSRNVTWKYTAS